MGVLIIILGLLLLPPAWLLRRGRWWRRATAMLLALAALVTLFCGGYWTWFTHRGQPADVVQQWYPGVRYERVSLRQPRPMVLHIVTVDLTAPNVRLVFTPPAIDAAATKTTAASLERPLIAQTTSHFAQAHHAQVAINASFFFPFHSNNPFDYFPHEGESVQAVGLSAFEGIVYQRNPWRPATFFVDERGGASFLFPEVQPYNAISGSGNLVEAGRSRALDDPVERIYPRTALGLDRARQTLILVVVDGKQPNYSEGATLPELADILLQHGAFNAINLDGGGSSTLVRETAPGTWTVVNMPCSFKMPRWERPVANHLGIQVGG